MNWDSFRTVLDLIWLRDDDGSLQLHPSHHSIISMLLFFSLLFFVSLVFRNWFISPVPLCWHSNGFGFPLNLPFFLISLSTPTEFFLQKCLFDGDSNFELVVFTNILQVYPLKLVIWQPWKQSLWNVYIWWWRTVKTGSRTLWIETNLWAWTVILDLAIPPNLLEVLASLDSVHSIHCGPYLISQGWSLLCPPPPQFI